jgi:hypothetical protein
MYVEIKSPLADDVFLVSMGRRKCGLSRQGRRDGRKARAKPAARRCWDNRPLFDCLAGFGSAHVLQIEFQGIDYYLSDILGLHKTGSLHNTAQFKLPT